MRKALIGALVAVGILSIVGTSKPSVSAATTALDVTIVGKNLPVIDTLAKEQAGNAIPALAELNVLKVSSAKNADGKDIADLKNKTFYYVPVKSAEPLILGKAAAGKWFEMKGKVFKAENAFLVVESKETKAPADEFGSLPITTLTRKAIIN